MPDERWDWIRRNLEDAYYVQQALDALRREHEAALVTLATLRQWALEHGAALCPPSTDSYGDGMRDAKRQVHAILDRAAYDAAKAGGGA